MDENKELIPAEQAAENTALAESAPQAVYAPSIWNDSKLLAQAFKAAKFLASSELVPEQTYRSKPENCLIAIDLANRMNMPPLIVMQNLYIVKGKPGWSGQFCIALINGCGRFSPLDFVFTEENGGSCYATATRFADGKNITGTTVSMTMAKNEGWLDKNGSKWKTMPEQMLRYRAASFFAKAYCPDILCGIQTADEVRDVDGYDNEPAPVITVELD